MTTSTPAVRHARDVLVLALDVDDLGRATALADAVGGHFAIVKIGLELFTAEGPDAVRAFQARGFAVLLDLKLHDIPTTVGRAARIVGRLGVRYVTVHSQGGSRMLEAAAEGLRAGAHDVGLPAPVGLGVTVLTSDPTPDTETLRDRARLIVDAGLGGYVCAAPDLKVLRAAAPGLVALVPGTRPHGTDTDDQSRTATPGEAVRLGADLLVVGRAVTASADPLAAAATIEDEVNAALR
jgi:orotidine-5'-phosphate decarboxylase